jgi:aminopeptidase N
VRGLNKDFYHQTITSRQVENYIALQSGKDLSKVFEQYLRTPKIPVLEYKQSGTNIQYRWNNIVSNFMMPVKLADGQWIMPSAVWKTMKLKAGQQFTIDKNFYIDVRKL